CGSYRLYSSDGAQIPLDQCWMALAIKENKAYEGREIVIERPDGSRLTVLAHVNPFYNEAGKLLGVVNIVVDITDRKQAEAVKAQMAAIVESSDDAIVSKDLNGIITSWNKGAQKLFGYTAEEVIGKSVTILYPPDRENEESYILDRIRRGEGVDHYETVRRRKDGSEIDISLTVSPVRDETGKVIGASKIARDISDRKRIEIEREEMLRRETAARAEAEQTSRLKDEFLAAVSHELRSPLNAILGWSRMLGENRLDKEKTARAFEVICRNANAQNQLIGDLLEVSRIITGKLNLDVSEVELIPIINAAIDVVRPAAEAKNIRLISTLDPAAGLVWVDAGRLQQVVWNLLSNAVKFTPGGGQVAVSLEREATHITLTVSDTGEGIEPEFLPYVFDRFRQFEGDTKRAHGGLGLGLAIVRHLVELHGGTVGAASLGKGRGATFTVTLPLAAPREEAGEVGRARPAGAGEISRDSVLTPDYLRLRGLRVLVVDDEPDALEVLSLMLTNHGAEVKTCASAAEALQTLDEWQPDALVSDIGMPREDGYDLLRKIRAREPERGGRTPAIALTAYARAEDARRALAAGYQMHIPKPVESDLLAATVASLAGQEG
ncbi:MAG TPA: PAS domain S-box protein, partial [Blastocatellia bacterium]